MSIEESSHTQLIAGESHVADLAETNLDGPSGVAWALASPQLNANLVMLRPGDGIEDHVNDEVDVLIVIQSGSGFVVIDGAQSDVGHGSIALVPRGSRRSIRSVTGLAYYSIHQRRDGLSIAKKTND